MLASIYCQADMAHLCDKCDLEIHKSKLASRHVRMSLEKVMTIKYYIVSSIFDTLFQGPQCMIPCRIHSERNSEFFCPSCHMLVCLNCKMIGHHSTGEAVKHPLVPVADAYQSVIESAHLPDPVVEERIEALKQHLEKIERRGQAIIENAKSVREHIDLVYKKAMDELSAIVNKRVSIFDYTGFTFECV
jgi:B-box zinc finger